MNVDLPGTIRLLHRVLGFLTALSAEELRDVAAGRRSLLLGATEDRSKAASATTTLVPGPRGEKAGQATKAGQAAEAGQAAKGGQGGGAGPIIRAEPETKAGPGAQAAPTAKARRATKAGVAEPTDADYAAVAEQLRALGSVDEGAAYLTALQLRGKKRRKADLIKIGAQMGLTLAASARDADLENRLINHAIGAKKKYAGLTSW